MAESLGENLEILDILRSFYRVLVVKGAGVYCHWISLLLTILICVATYCYGGVGKAQEVTWCIVLAILVPVMELIGSIFEHSKEAISKKEREQYKSKISRLEGDNKQLRDKVNGMSPIEKHYSALFDAWAGHLLRLQKSTGRCRATLYMYDDQGGAGDAFVQVARDSEDPKLRNKGRERYPSDQGVIAQAWNSPRGEASYFAANKCDESQIVSDFVREFNFKQEEAESLYFKPRIILGVVLKDVKGKVGVVIFESDANLQKRLQKQYKNRFRQTVSSLSVPLIRTFEVYRDYALNQEEEEVGK